MRDIDALYRTLSRDVGLAPSTVRQIHNILTGSLDQAVRWGWRGDNPAKLATPPSVRQAEVRPPSPGDVVAAIALADRRLHDLRHFAATRLLDAGVPVKTVSGHLGHARRATTLNVYALFIPASDASPPTPWARSSLEARRPP